MQNFLAKLNFILFYHRMPKSYCCAKCGAEQREETSTHIIFCNSCSDELFKEIRERNIETRKFLEEHKDEIAAWQKSEVERLKAKNDY